MKTFGSSTSVALSLIVGLSKGLITNHPKKKSPGPKLLSSIISYSSIQWIGRGSCMKNALQYTKSSKDKRPLQYCLQAFLKFEVSCVVQVREETTPITILDFSIKRSRICCFNKKIAVFTIQLMTICYFVCNIQCINVDTSKHESFTPI